MRSEIRMMLALASPGSGCADQPSGSRASGGLAAHVRRARPKATPVGEMLDYPHKYPPRDPADWSDLMVHEISRTESQDPNSLSLLGFSQPFMVVRCLPFGSPDVPEKIVARAHFPPGSRGSRPVRQRLRGCGRRQDMRRAESRSDEEGFGRARTARIGPDRGHVVSRISDSRPQVL